MWQAWVNGILGLWVFIAAFLSFGSKGIFWDDLIVGGESGPNAREMKHEWAEEIMKECEAANVPFFMKQMSRRQPVPEHLQKREFPKRLP